MENEFQHDPDNVDPDLDTTDSDELVALCFDCLSVIPERIAEKDMFAMSGKSGICPFCTGPFRIIPQRAVESLKRRRQAGEMINPG
jgi:hypothetical protein